MYACNYVYLNIYLIITYHFSNLVSWIKNRGYFVEKTMLQQKFHGWSIYIWIKKIAKWNTTFSLHKMALVKEEAFLLMIILAMGYTSGKALILFGHKLTTWGNVILITNNIFFESK